MPWDYDTVAETVRAFRAKWNAPGPCTAVEEMVDDVCALVDDAEEEADEEVLEQAGERALKAEARVLQAIQEGVPADDILLALYIGSQTVDLVPRKTFGLSHVLARRFLAAFPDVHIPVAFRTAPPAWRPVVGDEWIVAEWKFNEGALHYLMARASGVVCAIPWAPNAALPANYRAPVNLDADDPGIDANECAVLVHLYTELLQ